VNLVRFRLDLADGVSVGPGKIELLELLDAHGSISAAARAMRISYRKAWLLLDNLNTGFGEHVFHTATGGRRGGGARLTPFGRRLIDRYRKLERAVERLAERAVDDLVPRPAAGATSARRRPLTRHAASVRRSKRRP
jgi:molybdate transport system regulatory protein